MTRLSPIQWLLVAVFLAFYGFAVFALTRDYYLRNPVHTAATRPADSSTHALPQSQRVTRTWIQDAMQRDQDALPASFAESNPVLLNQEADELFAQKRYGEAIPLYRQVIDLDPDDLDAYNDLGLALHYSGQSEPGLAVLRAGAAKGPEFQRIWLTLGFVSAQAGDSAGARPALEKARDLDSNNGIGKEAVRLLGLLNGG